MFGGKTMEAISVGKRAPHFELPFIEGGGEFSLKEALARGPVLLVFFKISCPVCQYALPFIERIYKAHGGGKVTIAAISQNGAKDTRQFLDRFGITFDVLLDDPKTFSVSNAYGLTNVPTAFWIAEDGEVVISSVGWAKADVEEMAAKAAERNQAKATSLFRPGEQIADFRAG
jgi:peroxiredoxin